MQKKILSLFMIILFFAANPTVFSEEPPEPPPQNDFQHNQFPHKSPPRNMIMNYNGRKMPRRYCEFSIIGVKVEEEKKSLAILVYFNDALDTTSILERNILIDDIKVGSWIAVSKFETDTKTLEARRIVVAKE